MSTRTTRPCGTSVRFNIKGSIVMEFADNGDLFQKITEHQKNSSSFTENEIWQVFIQVVRGLRALHELKILHRDMKVPYIGQ